MNSVKKTLKQQTTKWNKKNKKKNQITTQTILERELGRDLVGVFGNTIAGIIHLADEHLHIDVARSCLLERVLKPALRAIGDDFRQSQPRRDAAVLRRRHRPVPLRFAAAAAATVDVVARLLRPAPDQLRR